VDAYPTFLKEEDVQQMVIHTFSGYLKEIKNSYEKKLAEEISSYISTKATFSKQETLKLLQNLQSCKDPFYTPAGKPILIQCKTKDIQRLFNTKSAPICQYLNV